MKNKGFTLVELAIVIVIIGLLVSGVLAGQELVKQAKIRAQIKQIEGYDTSALTFKGKYGYIPGDVTENDATKFGFSWGSEFGGNNKLEDHLARIPNISTYYENAHFFFHMSEKKLIKEYLYQVGGSSLIGQKYPKSEMGEWGLAAVGMPDGVNYFLGPTKKVSPINDNSFVLSSDVPPLSPADASSLDEKFDDGIPSRGKVRAVIVSNSAGVNFTNDATLSSCLGASNLVYNLASDMPLCRLVIKSKVD